MPVLYKIMVREGETYPCYSPDEDPWVQAGPEFRSEAEAQAYLNAHDDTLCPTGNREYYREIEIVKVTR